MLSSTELMIVVMVIMLMFGSSQIPKMAKNLGIAQKELKNALSGDESQTSPAETPEAAETPETAPATEVTVAATAET